MVHRQSFRQSTRVHIIVKHFFLSQGGTIEQRNPKAKGTHRAQTCCPLWGTAFCQGPLELLLPLSLQLLLVLGLASHPPCSQRRRLRMRLKSFPPSSWHLVLDGYCMRSSRIIQQSGWAWGSLPKLTPSKHHCHSHQTVLRSCVACFSVYFSASLYTTT